jgi:hypothetical protein
MRLFIPVVIATLIPADQSVRAQSASAVCSDQDGFLLRDGIRGGSTRIIGAHTRAGQPCQMSFGLGGANILALEIRVRPAHGVLGISEKEENRRYIAYAPHKGFVGHDQFEVLVRATPPTMGNSYLTWIKVEMNVTP